MSRSDEGCGGGDPARRDVVKNGIAAAAAPAMAAAAVGTNVPGVLYESRTAGDPALRATRPASAASSFPTVATWSRPTLPWRACVHKPIDPTIL